MHADGVRVPCLRLPERFRLISHRNFDGSGRFRVLRKVYTVRWGRCRRNHSAPFILYRDRFLCVLALLGAVQLCNFAERDLNSGRLPGTSLL